MQNIEFVYFFSLVPHLGILSWKRGNFRCNLVILNFRKFR